jgi:hypothetical protein
MTEPGNGVGDSWRRGWAVLNELAVHALAIIFVIACIEVIRFFTKFFDEIVFFVGSGFEFPAKWLLDAADVAMIVSLVTVGILATIRAYRGPKK